ncbi:S1C family serine protease [Fodinicola feengrottensis]
MSEHTDPQQPWMPPSASGEAAAGHQNVPTAGQSAGDATPVSAESAAPVSAADTAETPLVAGADPYVQSAGGHEAESYAQTSAEPAGQHAAEPYADAAAGYHVPPFAGTSSGGVPPIPPLGSFSAPPGAPGPYQQVTVDASGGRRNRWPMIAIAAVVAALVTGGVAGAGGAALVLATAGSGGGQTVSTAAPVSGSTNPTQQISKVAAAISPSVVSIKVTTSSGGDEGSGMVVTPDGNIVTNNHVVAAAANGGGTLTVTLANGKTVPATIVGTDPTTDIAVVKATGVSGLTPVSFVNSSSLHVGDTVIAFGNPLGLEGSVTSGIVSALHRSVTLGSTQQGGGGQGGLGGGQGGQGGSGNGGQSTTETASVSNAIQTDAAINPGNSGGPLVNTSGQVVGITTAIATLGGGQSESGSIGVGFAIPAETIQSVANQLMNGKKPTHANLGVSVTDATSGGAQISQITSGSPAAKAGLQTGDVITKVGDTAITTSDDLGAAVRSHQPGDKVTLTITRGGKSSAVTITLGSATG